MNKKNRQIRRTVILVLLAVAIIYTLYANFTKDDRKVAAVGDKAPDFVLTDLDGKEYKLSDYKGKGVFLNFWGTYCKPCKKEMPYVDNQYKKYKEQGVEVLAVNVGETDLAIETFANQYGLSFPIVVDEDAEVQEAYGIYPLPATFLINPDGKIVKYITGEMNEQMVQQYMEMIKP
ncbi:thiol-disulfide oxidoreductase ResA [Caldibacillus lycopersici]|uniref:Thiol-disulfide oxidoreductase ResA n=1 Tax=Perspicuibacillus lycopersici TaxID=1325689 RepID=A0AAE3LQQ0_9BACI|nr:thiol-disulfide oxidoreductase ResA [Perspicuibacillus lycopersici]MCU9613749.1 thiol-disulfide oxidoreductase ResA [Perspicuibacillus lycopersici]